MAAQEVRPARSVLEPHAQGAGLSTWHLRDLTDSDLEDAVALEAASERGRSVGTVPAGRGGRELLAGQPTVAAEVQGDLIGVAVGRWTVTAAG